MRAILLSVPALLLGAHLALADSDDITPTQDDHPAHKMIKPTSPGSSGNGVEPSSTPSSGEEGSLAGTQTPDPRPQSSSTATQINPYPNAVGPTGKVDGGSVNGTGALNSAFPGH
jgi:hypothetical protein